MHCCVSTTHVDRCEGLVVMEKFGSVRFRAIFPEPQTGPSVWFRDFPEPQTEPLVQVQKGPVQVRHLSEPEPNLNVNTRWCLIT
jgi:hypothetical protein